MAERILTLIRRVVGRFRKESFVVPLLELDGIRARKRSRLNHFFSRFHITLMVSPYLCHHIGHGVISNSRGANGKRTGV